MEALELTDDRLDEGRVDGCDPVFEDGGGGIDCMEGGVLGRVPV